MFKVDLSQQGPDMVRVEDTQKLLEKNHDWWSEKYMMTKLLRKIELSVLGSFHNIEKHFKYGMLLLRLFSICKNHYLTLSEGKILKNIFY